MSEMQEKVARLPAWARELIKRLEALPGVLVDEAAKLRQENATLANRAKRLSDANEALVEILRFAGKGGSDWAAEVVRTLEGYEIFKSG